MSETARAAMGGAPADSMVLPLRAAAGEPARSPTTPQTITGDAAPLGATPRRRLGVIRALESASRLTRARDPRRTCRLAVAYGAPCPKGCALTFFRLLEASARQKPRYYPASAIDVTLHEAWLLRLLERIEADDASSVKALIAFRIAPEHRRGMLAAAIEFCGHIAALELKAA